MSLRNVFAERDYWLAILVCATWINGAYNILSSIEGVLHPPIAAIIALVIQSAVLALPLVYSKWAPWVVLVDFIGYAGNLVGSTLTGSRERVSWSAISLGILLGILCLVLLWRRSRKLG